MQLHRCMAVIFLWCLAVGAEALDLTQLNLNYQYDIFANLKTNYRVVSEGDQLSVYYSVESDTVNKWDQHFLIQGKYNSDNHDTLTDYSLDTLHYELGLAYFKLTISGSIEPLLLITFVDLDRGIYRIQDVRVQSPVGFPSALPHDGSGLPILTSYVTSRSVNLRSDLDRLHVYRYLDDFGSADPPMGVMKAIAPSLAIDSSYYFQSDLEALEDYHFYLIQEDSLSENGLTLLKCPPYYPEYKKLEELVGPLTYITTPTEIKTLRSNLSKKSFERFWINTYGTKYRAKNAIRVFYNQVENANTLFTDYKQGWKTDRGMIYIIYGRPDQVQRSERSEIWRYKDGPEFEFIRISTLFTPMMYTLKRDRKYEKPWYNQVGNIRKGL